ncbi:MAG: hypothetical protein II581_01850, partial [Oscillospiraceae bacterium]|nr:hypothetical protein [Oscillospiraceae bacterium]
SGWDRSAALYQLMQGIEQGVVDSDTWMMQYNKRMEALKTGKNELEYRKALSKKLDYGVKDTKDGIPVMMTKLQALQILMTAEREAANDKLVHLQKGGAEIRDAVKIQEGKAAKATSYHIDVTPELIQKIRDSLTEWDKQYMQTVHDYFMTESREMNKILYSLKNRVLETEEAYVPYIVDSNYLETKLTEQQAMNMWVKTPGSTNALKTKASQPVIIDGMDTVMAKHVRESADYIGLALPIRDFSKVYNGMLSQGEGEIALPVKKTIADNWGEKGAKLLTDAVLDVQGSSRVGSYNTAIAAYLNKLQSGFVKSALLINPSVTIKQAASYIAAESVISHRALIAGNRPLFNGQDASRSPSLIAQIFAAPSGSTATRIYNEIDEHTSMHYVRRQGMSYTELANEANRQGWLKRNTGMIGARMEQNAVGHGARKVGQALNPVQWIQRMDVATTAALWVACKEQAKMDGMEVGSSEYWQRTTELYEQALRETQPMYDNLHRTNMQKEKTGLMQFLFPFRTVPVQNHGQIAASFDAMLAAKGKSREEQTDAYKHFAKTVWAQTESAVVFSVMTFLAAGLKRKTGKYRDEDDEISPESILKGILSDTGGVWLSNILPMTGSEIWSWGSKAINSLKGVPNGYTFDTFSVGVVDMLNDLDTAADRMFKASGKLSRGEISFGEFAKTGDSFLSTFAKIFGIPAPTIKTYAEGLWGDVQDIREGRIPAYNDDAVERKNSTNARRFTKAWNAKDEAKMNAVLEEMFGSMVRTSDEAQSARNALSAAAKEAYQTGKMDLEEYVEYLEKTEAFTSKGITTRVSTMLKEDFIAGKRTAEETVELLVKYKDYKGNPEQKAWAAVKEWAAKAEHDDEDDYDWNQYDELKAAIAAGEGVQDEIQELKDHGYTQKQINDALKKSIQEAFTAGNYTEGEAIDALVKYGVTYSQNGKTVAYDQDKGWQTVREWAAKAGHEDDEDFSYSLYDNLRSAIAAGNGIEAAMKELTDHGVKEADVNDELNKSVLKLYTEGAITEKTAIGLLTKYHTVTKDKMTRPQTADEAWSALQKASAEAAHADEEDYSYSKYDDIDAALDKNGDISKLVKQLTDHGEKPANITNHVKGYLIDRYVAGEASESALKNQLSRYCGITKTDEVAGILKDANCEKDCGYGWSDLKNAYGNGDLSASAAKKMLQKHGGLSAQGAEHRLGYWDYCMKNPDTSISAQGWDSYYEKTLPNIGGTLSGRGMKQSSFAQYLEKRAQLEITDLDGDGKKDNKEYIVNLIASLNLSSAEKDMLYYYNNYGARDLWKTPWH